MIKTEKNWITQNSIKIDRIKTKEPQIPKIDNGHDKKYVHKILQMSNTTDIKFHSIRTQISSIGTI